MTTTAMDFLRRPHTAWLAIAACAWMLSSAPTHAAPGSTEVKLVGRAAVGVATQGQAVALSADGTTAIVGGNNDDTANGAVWIYTRTGDVWSQQGPKLVGTGAAGAAQQGFSVALSADGNTALVGAFADDNQVGAAWVWTRSNGAWSQQGAKLVGNDATGAGSTFGWSVALSSDGNTALIGGFGDNGNAGAAWVFTRSGGTWSQQGTKLVGSGATGAAGQGIGVALAADGNTAAVGGSSDAGGVGAVWIFKRNAGTWAQQGTKLVANDTAGTSHLGFSVALSDTGTTLVTGGWGDAGNVGATWIFTSNGSVWTQKGAKLVGTGGVGGSNQGYSVALTGDANLALVGGYLDNGGIGAAWLFSGRSGTWTQVGPKLVGNLRLGPTSRLGKSVALADNGLVALAGGNGDSGNKGAAWVFGEPRCTLDVDGSGTLDAATDGAILLRAMLGLTGNAVTAGLSTSGAARADWTALRAYLNANCGGTFAP